MRGRCVGWRRLRGGNSRGCGDALGAGCQHDPGAVRQARAAGHTMDDELVLLASHGVLHLLGYDHMVPVEEKEMFGLQQKLLDGWKAAPREPVTGAPTTREPGQR